MPLSCPDCETVFHSKWALDQHRSSCPVKLSRDIGELVRDFEARLFRIKDSNNQGYVSAAKAFAGYATKDMEAARRSHKWLADTAELVSNEISRLSEDVKQANKLAFPRLARLSREMGDEIDRSADLVSMLRVVDQVSRTR